MASVHNGNEHSADRSNRKIAPVFVYPALRVMCPTATPCRVSVVTPDGREATSGMSGTPSNLSLRLKAQKAPPVRRFFANSRSFFLSFFRAL